MNCQASLEPTPSQKHRAPIGDLSGPGSGQWSMGNSFWTSICINLWLTPTNTILGVHSSSWVNMARINQHPINTESSLHRGTSEPWIEIVRRGTEHTGREGTEDSLQKRIPQMLTEAVMCSMLETGQRQQQYVSVIFLISTLGMWMGRKVNRWMEHTHHSAMGTSAHSDHLVLSSNVGSVSPSK